MSSFLEKIQSSTRFVGRQSPDKTTCRGHLSQSLSNFRFTAATLLAVGALGFSDRSSAQTTIFSENMGTPTGNTAISTYASGTAPTTFQNKGTLTYGIGDQTTGGDVRITSPSSTAPTYTGNSGGGNIFLTSTSGAYGFSIESINASAYNTLQLTFGYRKESASALAALSVDYWNGASWVTIQNTSAGLFNETATSAVGWYLSKTLSLPAGAQVSGLKLRFVKTGTASIRIDDVKLTGTPAGGDTTPPTISSVSPTNGSTTVDIRSPLLTATFSEAVQAGTGTILLTKTSDSSTVPASVVIAGSTLSITPTSNLDYSTGYSVVVPVGAIKDLANNNFGGIPASTAWSFTTAAPDTTPPTITAVTPTSGSSAIARPSALTITFSENVQVARSGSPKIYVKRVSDDASAAEIDATNFGPNFVVGNVATVPLSAPLDFDTQYYVVVDAGAFEDVSPNNNPFGGLPKFIQPANTVLSWSFSTLAVPVLTTAGPYTETFSTFTSSTTLPSNWSITSNGSATNKYDYSAWSTTTTPNISTGIKFSSVTPVINVFGYQATGSTGTVVQQTLNLTNGTGATLTGLTVSYRGRQARAGAGRTPTYAVTLKYGVTTTTVAALAYSTSEGDNVLKVASIDSLSIPAGGAFSLVWTFDGEGATGSGNREQIGISDVSVSAAVATFPPTVAGITPDYSTLAASAVTVNTGVTTDGGSTVTARGVVYSSTDTTPTILEGATTIVDPGTTVDAFSASLTGLTAATRYYISSYATNSKGTTYSSVTSVYTLAAPPSLVTQYTQGFSNFTGSIVTGTLPAGWKVVSSGGLNSYAGTWGPSTSSGGLVGGVAAPSGVLGYQHVGGSATVTASLTLKNDTATTLTQLYVSYLGRVERTDQTRQPAWTVSLDGNPVTALDYSTAAGVDQTKATLITGLSIVPGATTTLSWVSDGNVGTGGGRRQIGISNVLVVVPTPPTLATASASSITATTATLNGTVSADGYSPITARGFVYSVTSTNADPLISGTGVTNVVEGGTTVAAFNSALTGLTAGTGYSLKAYATNSLGTTYSTVATFTTTAAGGYLTWANAYAPGQAANLDHDNDGVPNGVEYFMGATGSSFTATPGIVGGSVTWPKGSTYTGVYGTDFVLQTSTNLSSWTPVPSNSTSLHDTTGSVSFDLPTAPGPFFVRLMVTP